MLLYSLLARKEPFAGEDAIQVMQAVMDATADELKRPTVDELNVDTAIVALMESCWANDPRERPSFSEICTMLARYGKQTLADNLIQEVQRGKALLQQILPPRVSKALQEGRPVEPEYYDQCTIYFSDVVGFTNISSVLPPKDVMSMLNDLYIRLDAVAREHDVWKVETTGDAWMGCTNLQVTQADHAARAARFALAAMAAASEVVMPGTIDKRITIRVGLHSGPVAASVIGTTNPRYCLFGDTVNVASRMESTSEPGRIQMTVPTARLVQKQDNSLSYRLKRRAGAIEVKGKGIMKTWWLMTDTELVKKQISRMQNPEAATPTRLPARPSFEDSATPQWSRSRRSSG
jgi:class 3 adenylate cyclase